MIRLWYLSTIRLHSKRAHVHNIAKTCEALQKIGDIAPTLLTHEQFTDDQQKTFFTTHGVDTTFLMRTLNSFGARFYASSSKLKSRLSMPLLTLSFIRTIFVHRAEIDVLYYRDHAWLVVALFARYILRIPVVFECHYVLRRRFGQWLTERAVQHASGVVMISRSLEEYYATRTKASIVSYCGAVDEEYFAQVPAVERSIVGVPEDAFVFGYTGNLGKTGNDDMYRLNDIVASLAAAPSPVHLVLVGEQNNNAEWLRSVARTCEVEDRLHIVSWQLRDCIPGYLKMADALVLPQREHDLPGDSPIKLFEYLHAGKPLIAASAQAIAELLVHEKHALLVPPSHAPKDWAVAINRLYTDVALQSSLGRECKTLAKAYTWERRGEEISVFIQMSCNSIKTDQI